MIYRVEVIGGSDSGRAGEHLGYCYFGSQREARAEVRSQIQDGNEATIQDKRSVPQTKDAMIALLRLWGTHSDNG